jgi:glycosyltransferase involved in cell wall biosynthesis
MKTVDIVIINYNDKLRVSRAIESALNQTYSETNVILVDDGSDKETRELYKRYGKGITVVQLERTDKAERTPSRARNAGIDVSNSDYISFLDSDNYYHPTFVENLVKHDKDYAFCNWDIVGLQDYAVNIEQVWNRPNILENYLSFQHLDHQCILIKREYLDRVGKYDTRLPRSQDCDLIARLILRGGTYFHDANKGFVFEKHEEDQNKSIASTHGKALWTLKNNINIGWMAGMMQNPFNIMGVYRAIDDFMHNPKWKEDYDHSEFKQMNEQHLQMLGVETKEKVL